MGILRLYLALCVVAAHAGRFLPFQMQDGPQAVEIFFIISGFYMALVLSRQYKSQREFYVSRLLRIFLPYWISLGGILLVSFLSGQCFGHWLALSAYVGALDHNGAAGIVFVSIVNTTLFFQDWVLFFQQDQGSAFTFTSNFYSSTQPLHRYLVLPQCWSVGIELTFYLVVPYLARLKSSALAWLVVASLIARLLAYRYLKLDHDPWTYRFFPFELSLFALGMLGYRFYLKIPPDYFQRPRSYLLGASLLVLALLVTARITNSFIMHVGRTPTLLASYLAWPFAIAIIFGFSRRNSFDRLIGELSYPIYLQHGIVVSALTASSAFPSRLIPLGSVFGTLYISWLSYHYLFSKFEAKRHQLAARTAGFAPTPDGIEVPAPDDGQGSPRVTSFP